MFNNRISNEELASRIAQLMPMLESLRETLRFEVMLVTPEIAMDWLRKNTKNRDTDTRKYSYARQMVEKAWGFSGQPIIFSDTDLLLDGGGRLTGVVESNCPIVTTVIYGVPEAAFKCMDFIKVRTAKDVLYASHLLDTETKQVRGYVASIAKRISEWGPERFGSHGNSTSRSNVANSIEIQEFIEENISTLRDCAKSNAALKGAHREKLLKKQDYIGSMMAYLIIYKGWDFSDVYPFFDELTNVHSSVRGEGNPIATLRHYLFKHYIKELHITDKEMFHMFARAWNEYINNGNIKRFSLKTCRDIPFSKPEFTATRSTK